MSISKKISPVSPGLEEAAVLIRAKHTAKAHETVANLRKVGKLGNGGPTEEQIHASAARRAQQEIDSAKKPFVRHPGKQAPVWGQHGHIRRGPVISVASAGALAGGAGYAAHRLNKGIKPGKLIRANSSQLKNAGTMAGYGIGGGALVGVGDQLVMGRRKKRFAKSDTKQYATTALGGIAGASTASAVNITGGQAAKAHLKIQRARHGTSAQDEKVWSAHKAKFGVHGQTSREIPNKTLVRMHESYPKVLPGWRTQRALGFKNRAATRTGTKLVGAAVGAELVRRHYAKKKVAKYATTAQLRRRKKIAANLGITSAAIGLTTLGARGAQGALKATKSPGAVKVAEGIQRHTQTALIIGTGVGSAGALNGAAINRAESKQPKKPVIKGASPFLTPMQTLGGNKPTPTKVTGPSVKQTAKTTLSNVTSGTSPQITAPLPGVKRMGQLQRATGLNKGFGAGFKGGMKAANRARPMPNRMVREGPKASHIAGRKTGAAAHDFGQGFSRKVHTQAEYSAGKVTTKNNAVYPGAYQSGHLTRRYGVPAVVLGGAYAGGRKLGRRNKVKKSQEGRLAPISKSYGYDSEASRHRRAGIMSGTALAVGSGATGGAVYQGIQAGKKGNFGVRRTGSKPAVSAVAATKGTPTTATAKATRGKPAVPASPAIKGKLHSVSIKRGGLAHGGKAVALAGGAGAAFGVAHHINRKQTQGSWRTYD